MRESQCSQITPQGKGRGQGFEYDVCSLDTYSRKKSMLLVRFTVSGSPFSFAALPARFHDSRNARQGNRFLM